jgi:ABC-type sugar transport system permease subunit
MAKTVAYPHLLPHSQTRISSYLGRDWAFAYALLIPLVAILLGLIAYPFISSISLSMQSKEIGSSGVFVGLKNFQELFSNQVFGKVVGNTLIYAGAGVLFKFLLGMVVALILNQEMRFRSFYRALVLLSWSAPVVVGCFTWLWIFDDMGGALNALLLAMRVITQPVGWLVNPHIVLWAVIAVVIWQGTPFYILNFLAGMASIDKELYEAAGMDGAGPVQRFIHITLPGLQQVIFVTVLMSLIWTSNDVQFVYILTRGGPLNMTMTFPMLAFRNAIQVGELGMGAAVALSFLPFLIPPIIILTTRLLRQER